MSKFRDLLENLGRPSQNSLGFGGEAKDQKVPHILVGWRGASPPTKNGEALADFAMLDPQADGTPNLNPPKDAILWGCLAKEIPADFTAQTLKDSGASFVTAATGDLPANILADEDVCTGYALPPHIDESGAKAVDAIGFDFLLLDAVIGSRLTLSAVLEIQKVIVQYSNHIFLNVANLPDPGDLQIIQDLPVSALILGKGCKGLDRLEEIRSAIADIEVRKRPSYALPPAQIQDFDLDDLDD